MAKTPVLFLLRRVKAESPIRRLKLHNESVARVLRRNVSRRHRLALQMHAAQADFHADILDDLQMALDEIRASLAELRKERQP